ncbi:MAG: Fe(3+) dicitrate transport protein [Salibacteraceae bacterium]|jgi:Fe(3+) dicitrate transport protein
MKKFVLVLLCAGFSLVGISQEKWNVVFVSSTNNTPISGLVAFSIELNKEFSSNKKGLISVPFKKFETISFLTQAEGFVSATSVLTPYQDDTVFVVEQVFNLSEVVVSDHRGEEELQQLQMRSVEDMYIFSGKKSERIEVTQLPANLATNNSRQVYSKVPGLNIFESNGAGLNTEIGGRGLSPERSTNFNMRQNGYDISADALGYPDAYYVPPAEGLKRIEVVRGAGALQYGTQFGGMINYKMKTPESDKPLQIESRQTVGSFGFFNSFNAVGGKYKKLAYYAFFIYKKGDGWRPHSDFTAKNFYGYLKYSPTEKLNFTFDFSYFTYLAHQPGGLTDAMFKDDASQSIRERNWFNVDWNLPSLTVDYSFKNQLKLSSKFFALIATRNASGFLGNITRTDPLLDRDLLQDNYLNVGNETKILKQYSIKKRLNTLIVGARFYRGDTHKQQGLTDDGYGPNFTYNNPDSLAGSDFKFPSQNIALFAENIFQVTDKLRLQPGLRYENIKTESNGYYRQTTRDLAGNILFDTLIDDQLSKPRSFVLFAIGASYKPSELLEIYGNISQNYKAINFNDLRINNPNFRVDPNLQDETGYNFDIGIRGKLKSFLVYDVSAFYLSYDNRIGFVQKVDSLLFKTYRYRTNVSASSTIGLEGVIEVDWFRLNTDMDKKNSLKTFVNLAFIDGQYTDSQESAFEGNKVELVPNLTAKAGVTWVQHKLKLSLQYSFTGEQFSDASNSEFDPNAVSGIIPSYQVMDFSFKYCFKVLYVEANINNLANNTYFTRRASGYPGPGIIPAEPRSVFVTLGLKIK